MYKTETKYGKKGDKNVEWRGGIPCLVIATGEWVVSCEGSKETCEISAKVDRNWGFKARVVNA